MPLKAANLCFQSCLSSVVAGISAMTPSSILLAPVPSAVLVLCTTSSDESILNLKRRNSDLKRVFYYPCIANGFSKKFHFCIPSLCHRIIRTYVDAIEKNTVYVKKYSQMLKNYTITMQSTGPGANKYRKLARNR